ncbi:Lrp/AsnC family transcriptional regulator [Paraferrimonas sedimenticola]|uniref:Lrp/AsnC family transcriptional regulator n=1 Tax=Paraferrimonas sedimenticola TaxID=375674 RepID=UPI000BA994F5|nr:Lrp/AsnC family transcriptional regulator [Paraferrimonas sedimenticola]
MDKYDKQILKLLQQDSSLSINELAEKVGLSSTPCWRRIQTLESNGVLTKRVALADAQKLNAGLCVFVTVRTNQHNPDWLAKFSQFAADMDEVIEFYRLSGTVDYLLKVMVPDMKAYDAFYKKLIQQADFSDISSSFAMEQIKYTTALPVDYL